MIYFNNSTIVDAPRLVLDFNVDKCFESSDFTTDAELGFLSNAVTTALE
jgi:hypothetical protein